MDFDYDRLKDLLEEHDRFEREMGWLSHEKFDSEEGRLEELAFMQDCLEDEVEELYRSLGEAGEDYTDEIDEEIGKELADVLMFVKGIAHCLRGDFNDYLEDKLEVNRERFYPEWRTKIPGLMEEADIKDVRQSNRGYEVAYHVRTGWPTHHVGGVGADPYTTRRREFDSWVETRDWLISYIEDATGEDLGIEAVDNYLQEEVTRI